MLRGILPSSTQTPGANAKACILCTSKTWWDMTEQTVRLYKRLRAVLGNGLNWDKIHLTPLKEGTAKVLISEKAGCT